KRCEQKYQSSVTRKSSLGCGRDSGAAAFAKGGRASTVEDKARQVRSARGLPRNRAIINASAGRSLAEIRRLAQLARILVTGAAGFIGSAVCRGLAARGHVPIAGLRRPAAPSDAAEGLLLGD